MPFKAGAAIVPDHDAADLVESPTDQPQTLSFVIKRIRFLNKVSGMFIVAASPVDDPFSETVLKGISPRFVESNPVGTTVECRGSWVEDARYGKQFDVLYVKDVIPTTPQALLKYLRAGRLRGIGPALAARAVDTWGMGLFAVLDQRPQELTALPGITPEKAKIIAADWKEKREFYGLVSFLGLHGVGEAKAMRAAEELGPEGLVERLQNNPYLLADVDGIGFKTADALAMSIGFAVNDRRRIDAALEHILHEKTQKDGHTAVQANEWVDLAMGYLNCSRQQVQEHCQRLLDGTVTDTGTAQPPRVVMRTLPAVMLSAGGARSVEEVQCVSRYRDAKAEFDIAADIVKLRAAFRPLSPLQKAQVAACIDDAERGLDPAQKEAAWRAATESVSIITGGPGTGKTTTLRAICQAFADAGRTVVLAAPTGRAAKRMEEATGVTASTMHRALGFVPSQGFRHNRSVPLTGDVFILDEVSMVDTGMLRAWLCAIPSGASVLLVGDADQLPSVGPGDVLRNLIESGCVPVSRLTRIHRQAAGSGIAAAAARVLSGMSPPSGGNPATDDFAFVAAQDNTAILSSLATLLTDLRARGVRASDIQVMSPQRTGEVGTQALNVFLRPLLNESTNVEPPEAPAQFIVGDRVMQTRNDYNKEVFNGDMGTVRLAEDDGSIVVEMEDGREVKYDKSAALGLTLGYAITIHKSQGGERPIVLLLCSRSHAYMLNRSLLYTGITRGRQKVLVVGQPQAAAMAAKRRDEQTRLTGLVHEVRRRAANNQKQAPARHTLCPP